MGNGSDEHEVLQWICCLCVVVGGTGCARGDSSCLGKRICLQSVAAKHHDTVDSPHPVPLCWGAAVEWPLNKPKPLAPHLRREELPAAFPATLQVQQCLPPVSCQDLFLAP